MSNKPIDAQNLPEGVSLGDLPDELYPFLDPVWGVMTGPDQYSVFGMRLLYHPEDAQGITMLEPAPPQAAQQFHLQGKHDQNSHGKGGTAAQTIARQAAGLSATGAFKNFDGEDDANAWGSMAFKDTASSLSSDEVTSLSGKPSGYQRGGAQLINSHLRGYGSAVSDPAQQELINRRTEDMRSVISRSTVPENVTAHRGLYGNDAVNALYDAWQPGSVYSDPGFMSTTLNKTEAGDTFSNKGGVTMEVRVPAGSKGYYMQASSSSPSSKSYEAELVYRQGTRFAVLDKFETEDGRRHVVVEVAP